MKRYDIIAIAVITLLCVSCSRSIPGDKAAPYNNQTAVSAEIREENVVPQEVKEEQQSSGNGDKQEDNKLQTGPEQSGNKQAEGRDNEEQGNNSVMPGNTGISEDKQQPINREETKDESPQVVELVNTYEASFAEAVNKGSFAIIEPFLAAGSPLYDSQKKLVQDLYGKGIKEEHLSHEVGFIYRDSETSSSYRVGVAGTDKILDPAGGESIKDYEWIYTVNNVDGELKIVGIDKWETFKADAELRKGNTKPDQYYLWGLFENSDAYLAGLLNGDDSKYLSKEIFAGNESRANYDSFVKDLRSRGKEFSLVKVEYLQHWNTSQKPYTAKKKYTLGYTDNDSVKREMNLYLTITVDYIRTETRLSIQGHTEITGFEYTIE